MKISKKYTAILLLLTLLLTVFTGCGRTMTDSAPAADEVKASEPTAAPTAAAAEAPVPESGDEPVVLAVREFHKRGNVILDTSFEALGEKNIAPADIVTVSVGDQTYEMPVGTSYSDVDSGDMICRFDTEDAVVILAINGGSFAETANMAVKETIDEDPGYRWDVKTDTVSIMLKEKGGYQDEYTVRNLVRTNEREDYGTLSDADFANCRAVSVGGMKENTVFRGSTPLDTDMGRNTYSMAFLQENGIQSILNLADSSEEMTSFDTYAGSYYAACQVWNAEMDYKFASDSYAEKVKDCVIFMLENEGPFFIHCKEGKARTGIFCAILECYLGASYEEMKNDYMMTFLNFYHVEEDSETYQTILRTNLTKTLCSLFDVSDLEQADLRSEAEAYLLSAGLTADELSALAAKIGA